MLLSLFLQKRPKIMLGLTLPSIKVTYQHKQEVLHACHQKLAHAICQYYRNRHPYEGNSGIVLMPLNGRKRISIILGYPTKQAYTGQLSPTLCDR